MNTLQTFSLNEIQLKNLSDEVINTALKLGADQAEVSLSFHKGFNVSIHGGNVEKVEYNQDKSIDIHVYMGKRMGSASLSDTRSGEIKKAVEAACHIANLTCEDAAAGLADKEDLAFNYPTLDLTYPWNISVNEAIELALQCEHEALSIDKRLISAEDVTIATSDALYAYANSQGFFGFFPYTRHEMSCILIAKQNDEMQRDYSYSVAADPSQLKSISFIAKEAADKTLKRLGARTIRTTKAPVIFIAEEARAFLRHFVAAISGSNLYRKSSFLVNHLNKKIFPSHIDLQEFPHLPGALGSAPFDNDGVSTRSNIFVKEGVLMNYALGHYAANKLGMKTTGNAGGVHNLTIKTSDKTLNDLLKSMHTGLLITETMGQGLNLVTGDYSKGVGGFWVENGEIQFPVQEVTVAGKLQDMYQRLIAVGNDVDMRGNIRTGSILLDDVIIAGN